MKLKIRLSEIPEEGRDFEFSEATEELAAALSDLVESRPFLCEFTIRPMTGVYQLEGVLKTNLLRICSVCGIEVEIPVESSLNELLVKRSRLEKGDSESKVGFLADTAGAPAVTEFDGDELNVIDFIHEMIALKDPAYPFCGGRDCNNRKEIDEKLRELSTTADSSIGRNTNPFKNLKLN